METIFINTAHALPAILDKGVTLRLLKGLKRNDETGCWEWQGCRSSRGWGKIKYQGKSHWVHRIAYAIFHGPLPEGLTVDHSYEAGCRSRGCCNPDHLVAMSVSENSKKRWENADNNSKKHSSSFA